jgi:hypothetical protein
LQFGTAYTWSKSLSVQDDQGGFVIVADIRRNYGRTSFDRRHMLVVNHIYELPFGAGKRYASSGPAKWVVGGWQLNGIFRVVTGSPFNITADAGPCNCPGNRLRRAGRRTIRQRGQEYWARANAGKLRLLDLPQLRFEGGLAARVSIRVLQPDKHPTVCQPRRQRKRR